MNKLFFISLIIIFQSTLVFSQTDQSGLRVSANLTNLYVDDVDDENSKIGFAAGIYVRKKLAGPITLQTEINYSLKGSQINYNGGLFNGSGAYRYNLSYAEIPVFMNVHVGEFLYLGVGPYAAALLSVKVKDVDGSGTVNTVEELDRDNFNTLDYGISAAIGFDFIGGTGGVRYNYGLVDVAPNGIYLDNGKNSVLQFYIGFGF